MATEGYNQAIAITRKLAQIKGVADQTVGAAYLALGIARSLGDEVSNHSANFGGQHFSSALSSIPIATSDELEQLPSLRPDANLKALLRGKLKPFREGTLDSGLALEILLTDRSVREEVASLLGIVLSEKSCNVADLFRHYSKLVFQGYLIGAVRYGIGFGKKLPDYVSGDGDREFEEKIEKFNQKKEKVAADLYSDIRPDSFFRGLLRQYGRVGAELLLAVLVNELTPYSKISQDGITVRELAWTLDPGNYHCFALEIVSEVEELVEEHEMLSYVKHPFSEYSALQKTVIPRDEALNTLCSHITRGNGENTDLIFS